MAEFDIIIQVLVNFALRQDNECSWYGSLNLLLSQGLNGFDRKKLTAVVPQLALAAIFDTDLYDDELIEASVEHALTLYMEFLSPKPQLPLLPNVAPSSSQHTIAPFQLPQHNIAPQQDTLFGLPDSAKSINLSYSPGSIRSMKKVLQKVQDLTSRRIPDFVRLRFYNYNRPTVRHRLDLLIVKKLPDDIDRRFVRYQTLSQITEQAYHAFKPDLQLLKVGCLIILGDEWMYTELERDEVNLLTSGDRDPTYEPSEGSSSSSATINPQTPPNRRNALAAPPPAAPDPNDMTQLHKAQYFKFDGPSAFARQRKMLKLIHDRLEVIDQSMVGLYTHA